MTSVNKKDLFGNEYNAATLCEYRKEIKLLQKLIKISESAVEKKTHQTLLSCEGVCYEFAKTIIDYSKVAVDNVLLGHFHAAKIITRTIIENLVCLDIIYNDQTLELWKYYWIQSYREDIYRMQRIPTQEEINRLYELYGEWGISQDFYVKQGNNKKAYIQKPYGWTYKIHPNVQKQFTFEEVCKLVDNMTEYQEFKLLSDYVHGTSFYTKIHTSTSVDEMMFMFVNLYISLYRMVAMYCWDKVNVDFDDVTEELEFIFHRYIQYEEENRV